MCWVLEFLSTGQIQVDIIKEVVCYLLMDITKVGPQMFLEKQEKDCDKLKK